MKKIILIISLAFTFLNQSCSEKKGIDYDFTNIKVNNPAKLGSFLGIQLGIPYNQYYKAMLELYSAGQVKFELSEIGPFSEYSGESIEKILQNKSMGYMKDYKMPDYPYPIKSCLYTFSFDENYSEEFSISPHFSNGDRLLKEIYLNCKLYDDMESLKSKYYTIIKTYIEKYGMFNRNGKLLLDRTFDEYVWDDNNYRLTICAFPDTYSVKSENSNAFIIAITYTNLKTVENENLQKNIEQKNKEDETKKAI